MEQFDTILTLKAKLNAFLASPIFSEQFTLTVLSLKRRPERSQTLLQRTFSQLHLQKQSMRSVSSRTTAKHQVMCTVIRQPDNSSIDRTAATACDKCAVLAFHSKVRWKREKHSMSFTLPEKTAFLAAAENESLLFSRKQRSCIACNSHLERTTQLQRGSLPSLNPHSNVMTHTNPNHLLKHVLEHSARWCVKTGCPIQSLGLGVSYGLEAAGRAGTGGLRTPSQVTWDFRRERTAIKRGGVGGAKGKVEGMNYSGDQLCVTFHSSPCPPGMLRTLGRMPRDTNHLLQPVYWGQSSQQATFPPQEIKDSSCHADKVLNVGVVCTEMWHLHFEI